MNKAFVREPDDTGQRHCPACGSLALAVGAATLEAQLSAELRQGLAESAYFCPYPHCEVAYFDDYERRVAAAALPQPVYPKSPSAPLCACFGLTLDDIEADLAEGTPRRVRALLEQARSAEARCTTRSASGRSCVAEVQRTYLRMQAAARSG
jgi:hypothetical protein